MRPSGPARPRRRLCAAALAGALALAGCAQIPQSSPVRSGAPLDVGSRAADAPQFRPPGPAEDATAEQLVRGFAQAGIAPEDGYAIARQYLSAEASDGWEPDRGVVVYSGEPTVTRGLGEGTYEVQLEVESEVDEFGQRTMAPPNTTQAREVTVEEVDGVLRITGVQDGVLLSRSQFAQLYAPHPLYFFDQSQAFVVPDVRWFVNRGTAVTALTRALLRGPAPYLTGAVATAFPLRTGADLTGPSVPVAEDGTAAVDLTGATVDGADPARLSRMREQLERTLTGVSGVERVEVTVEGRSLTSSAPSGSVPSARIGEDRGTVQVGVSDAGELVFFQGLDAVPVGGLPSVADLGPEDPTMDRERRRFVFLDRTRTVLHGVGTDGGEHRLLDGGRLTAPSLDSSGWAWTVDRARSSRISVVWADGSEPARVVTTPWLAEGESIVALHIGPAGARAALIVDDGQQRTLRVAGVVRGGDGVPTALTPPVYIPTLDPPDDVEWMGDGSLVSTPLAPDAETRVRPEVVSLDGTSRQLNPLAGLTGISAREEGTLYAETAEDVFLLVGSSWRAQDVATPVHDLAFPD